MPHPENSGTSRETALMVFVTVIRYWCSRALPRLHTHRALPTTAAKMLDVQRSSLRSAPECSLVAFEQYELRRRPRQDREWTIGFAICLLLTLAIGLYGVTHRDERPYFPEDHELWKDPRSCPYRISYPGRKLAEGSSSDKDFPSNSSSNHSMEQEHQVVFWTLTASLGSLTLGVGNIMLFMVIPEEMVAVGLGSQVFGVVLLGAFCIFRGSMLAACILATVAMILAFTYHFWRQEIRLCARLLGVCAAGLKRNPCLVPLAAAIKLLELLLVVTIASMMWFSAGHGEIVPNVKRKGRAACETPYGFPVPCCSVRNAGWVKGFWFLAVITVIWVFCVCRQLRTYVVAGSIAQWYFAPGGAHSTRGTTWTSFRNAIGPSFGSLSYAAAALGDYYLDKVNQYRYRLGKFLLCWRKNAQPTCEDELNVPVTMKFATIMASITGEDLYTAGEKATELLLRNSFKSSGVWWIPTVVLHTTSIMPSVFWGLFVYICYGGLIASTPEDHAAGRYIASLSTFAAALYFVFFGSILLKVVDTCYLCYVMDIDRQVVTKEEVHEVFSKVPVSTVDAEEYIQMCPNDLSQAVQPRNSQAQV